MSKFVSGLTALFPTVCHKLVTTDEVAGTHNLHAQDTDMPSGSILIRVGVFYRATPRGHSQPMRKQDEMLNLSSTLVQTKPNS